MSPLPRVLAWAASFASVLAFAVIAIRRLIHPAELDPIEGVVLDHIVRISEGQSIYIEPSVRFVPLAWMPGFATLCAPLAWAFGAQLWQPRLVTLLATLVTALTVVRVVRAETNNQTLAVTGMGLLFAGFGITGAVYDVGRPDMLALALGMAGLAWLSAREGMLHTVGASVLLVAAVMTRIEALIFPIAALAHLLVTDRPRMAGLTLLLLGGIVGGLMGLSSWFGRWFLFHAFEVPALWMRPSAGSLVEFVSRGVLGTCGGLIVAAILGLALPERVLRSRIGVWWWALAAAAGSGVLLTLDPSRRMEGMAPIVALLCLLGPVAMHRLVGHLGAWPGSERAGRSAALPLALLLQFVPFIAPFAASYRAHWPPKGAAAARTELVERLRQYPGDVLVADHGFYGWSAGKEVAVNARALDDILRASGNSLLAKDPNFFRRQFEKLRDDPDRPMIVSDAPLERTGRESRLLWQLVAQGYELGDSLSDDTHVLGPVNGPPRGPRWIYLPKQALEPLSDVNPETGVSPDLVAAEPAR